MVAKLPSKMVAINWRSILKWKMISATRLAHCATVFCAYWRFSLMVQNWCNCNLSRKKIQYLFAYSIFSYQLHHQCNCIPEGHIEREKFLLFEILISRQRNGWIQRLHKWSIWGDIWLCSCRIGEIWLLMSTGVREDRGSWGRGRPADEAGVERRSMPWYPVIQQSSNAGLATGLLAFTFVKSASHILRRCAVFFL